MSEREELEAVKVLASELFIDQYSAHKEWETAKDMAENFDTDAFVERIATALLSSGYTKGNGELVESVKAEERERLMKLALGSEADNYASYDGYVAEWLRSNTEEDHDQ